MFLSNGSQVPLAPQALAELVPQLQTSYYYPDGVGLELEQKFAQYGQIYKSIKWVHTVINKRANAVARLPIDVWQETGPERVLDIDSPYARLIAEPCSSYMDPFSFWSWICTTLDIYGEAYLMIARDANGMPEFLYPMHPSRVAIKRSPETGRYTYIFNGGPAASGYGLATFDQDDIIPFRYYNPDRVERGLSRMEPLRSTIMDEDSSRNNASSMWKHAGRPNIVIQHQNRLSDKSAEKLRRAFNGEHAGTSNAGKTLVLEGGMEAKAFQLTAVEMQYIEGRKLNAVEICAAYDIAPTMVHILDKATFSNIEHQMRAFYRDSIAPFIEFIESVLDHYLGKNFYTYQAKRRVMRFAVDEVIRGDFETRAESTQKLIGVGVYTPNEARHVMGLNNHDDPMADKLFINSTFQLLGQPREDIKLTGTIAEDPDGVPLQQPPAAGTAPGQLPAPAPKIPQLALPSPKPAAPAKPAAKTLDYSRPPLRELKSGIGRGRDIGELALKIAEKYPDDLQDILAAVEIAISQTRTK